MEDDRAIVLDGLPSLPLRPSRQPIYDGEFHLRLLYEDPDSGAEHYLVRYPAGLRARWHRHTAAQTIVVVEGRLEVNGRTVGPGGYCHLPGGEPMHHAPADGGSCLFVSIFHGPFDVEPVDR